MAQAVILGCGFTGRRVAALLQASGWETLCTSRTRGLRVDVEDAASLEQLSRVLTPDAVVLHSIPVSGVLPTLLKAPPARVVYLSTTGVYGATPSVDESTATAPRTDREQARAREEEGVLQGPWSALVLRPAAIYGPGRGIHASLRTGKYQLLAEGSNYVSRIHVDDLAALAAAALLSTVEGAFPVADRHPCTSGEIAAYCARLLELPLPEAAPAGALGETRRTNRRVDGSAIFALLGIALRYPSYREGIPACLAEEARAFSTS